MFVLKSFVYFWLLITIGIFNSFSHWAPNTLHVVEIIVVTIDYVPNTKMLLVFYGGCVCLFGYLDKGHVSFSHQLVTVVHRKLSHLNLLL